MTVKPLGETRTPTSRDVIEYNKHGIWAAHPVQSCDQVQQARGTTQTDKAHTIHSSSKSKVLLLWKRPRAPHLVRQASSKQEAIEQLGNQIAV